MSAPEPPPAAPVEPLAPPEPPGALRALLVATGGVGGSWPRCVLPFGAVTLLAGAAATAITFSLRGPHMDLEQGVALATLGAGLGLLAAALLCWGARRRAGRAGRREPGAA
ncbi:Transmembrane protein 100 [Vulpes lagopus]